ncbi:hypothetical protein C8F04DRAFT_1089122 [Mycena alexandri]|uniref:Uncharacterized protein n=1 Tax=Mycena alexandri TaxID=1745969 RepID=A0AAD6T405_9AGAR|nr:hypothetical protein C8F04DRAFT_1089122 [Mycena alexandri]
MTIAGGKRPPTTNLLLCDERTRIMRSARKLGAVMGTTPLLIDLEGPTPVHISPLDGPSTEIHLPTLREKSSGTRPSKREGVLFRTVSSQSSNCSIEYLEKTIPAPMPSIAKLSLSRESRDSLTSVTRLRLVLTLTQSPPSMGSYPSHSPHSCTDSVDSLQRALSILISTPTPSAPDLAARRRKMVKLVNMLGGPIPPSLVFPPPPKPQSRPDRTARRRSRSVPPTSFPGAPRKLVRPQHLEEPILPALSVDRISRPRPLAAYAPLRSTSASPISAGTVSSTASRGRPPTPSYSLRRRGRESTLGSES